jgi:hypothetical protein
MIGFIEIDRQKEAIIQCCLEPLEWSTVHAKWSTVQAKCLVGITLANYVNVSFVTVPIDSLVHPLCVIPDSGGKPSCCFAVLSKRN